MTKNEHAKEIVELFMPHADRINIGGALHWANAKACAIIHVNGIIDFLMKNDLKNKDAHWANSSEVKHLHEIKKILQKQ